MSIQHSARMPPILPLPSHSQANPIDLTLEDDDDEETHEADRVSKRMCSMSRDFNASRPSLPGPDYTRFQPYQCSSGLSPAMSTQSLADSAPQPSTPGIRPPPPEYPLPEPRYQNSCSANWRPPFEGISRSSDFFPPRIAAPDPSNPPRISHSLIHTPTPSTSRQVIDLTSSPSPPPPVAPSSAQPTPTALPQDLPPKTPVCIGQLTSTALVLYPVPYLQCNDSTATPDPDWAPVRLNYEHNANKPSEQETIHIKTPTLKSSTGEVFAGENFGVVAQKVATHLGPLLGKGLIRLDGKVRRGIPNLPILPLQLLVYTPKGNIPVVSQYLQQRGLYLDHPTLASDIQRLTHQHYFNPHNPPPGGRNRVMGPASSTRWSAPFVSGKSVEVQRSQVDELFRSLQDGDELEEAERPPEVATTLYPHQKKALTFLLRREGEYSGHTTGKQLSLWEERLNPLSGQKSWYHVITQREVFEEPRECKGAILADDMGLGKTITCVSLIAATLESSYRFADTPLTPPEPPPEMQYPDSVLSPDHFAGSVWDMPEPSRQPMSAKNKAKQTREHDKVQAEYMRARRIKTRSRATLIICPLSTVVNWEDQFREHWKGPVTVVGGGGGPVCTNGTASLAPSCSSTVLAGDTNIAANKITSRPREGKPLRVYVYHGNARRPDPTFLADFDAVITTYSTLASEFSKQTKSLASAEDEEEGNESDSVPEVDEKGNQVIRLPGKKSGMKKRKKPANGANGAEASSPLQSIHWFRVVLDEAHCIKETSTVGCRASCDLVADRRLCLTGTPVQNKLDDVFALIKFLRVDPLDEKSQWTEFIGTPVKYGQALGVARLQTIMKCITLRRTKESKNETGQKILALPPRRDELRLLKFDPHEQAIYDQFFTESKAEFNELSTKNEVMKNYVGILQKILRLRQICDHFELVKDKGLGLPTDGQSQEAPTSYEELVSIVEREGINTHRAFTIFSLLKESGITQCVECGVELAPPLDSIQSESGMMDVENNTGKRGRKSKLAASRGSTRQSSPSLPTPVLTRCQHLFCVECFRNSICPGWPNVAPDTGRCCSACQSVLYPIDAVEVSRECPVVEKKKAQKKERRVKGASLENFHPSTKVRALLGDLIQFSKANPHSANYDPTSIDVLMVDGQGNTIDDGVVKTVVFSQWTSMLDKIEDALEAAGIRYDRLDGTMKRDERTRAMDALKYDPACEVLLVSLKAGGVGLNLTAAQRVYLMDPYWNPAVENQAVDRIHRLGQTRPVTTVKLIIDNSIEARLLEVQKKKTELANMTLGQNFSKADMLQRRMEELNQLLS